MCELEEEKHTLVTGLNSGPNFAINSVNSSLLTSLSKNECVCEKNIGFGVKK